jgi:rhodanese-related sulfurtransferase
MGVLEGLPEAKIREINEVMTEGDVMFRSVLPSDVQKKLDQKESFILIDVREESEWAQGHLPHAIHLGKGILERDIEVKVPDIDQEIILYCGGGFRSVLAAENLQKMGYTNVHSMDGGFRAWKKEGKELIKSQ